MTEAFRLATNPRGKYGSVNSVQGGLCDKTFEINMMRQPKCIGSKALRSGNISRIFYVHKAHVKKCSNGFRGNVEI